MLDGLCVCVKERESVRESERQRVCIRIVSGLMALLLLLLFWCCCVKHTIEYITVHTHWYNTYSTNIVLWHKQFSDPTSETTTTMGVVENDYFVPYSKIGPEPHYRSNPDNNIRQVTHILHSFGSFFLKFPVYLFCNKEPHRIVTQRQHQKQQQQKKERKF